MNTAGVRRKVHSKSMVAGAKPYGARNPVPLSDEVVEAVRSLYADELKPFGRILRKRMVERSSERCAGSQAAAKDVDVRQLLLACSACKQLRVESEEGGDWSALLVGRPSSFVDIYSSEDTYPASLWEAAELYFEALGDSEMTLPGGRYSCAQVLRSRRLDFLQGLSLGRLCHVVQLAISQKKILGYLNGSVVPYQRSQSMVKERCAVWNQPFSTAGRSDAGLQTATWDSVRSCLREILETFGSEQGTRGMLPLSNVKRLFRSHFQLELSETALGHAKLSELLQDSRLCDVCSVRLQGHGYVVVPLLHKPRTQRPAAKPAAAGAVTSRPAETTPPGWPTISLVDSLPRPPTAEADAARPTAGAVLLRARPAPLTDFHTEDGTALLTHAASSDGAGGRDDAGGIAVPAGAATATTPGATTPAATTPVPYPSTPSPSAVRTASLPKLLGRNHLMAPTPSEKAVDSKAARAQPPGRTPRKTGRRPASAAPSTPGGAGTPSPLGDSVGGMLLRPLGGWPGAPLTPSTLGHMGFLVHNTFIHAPQPPPTPGSSATGSACRSSSLPRNMGSDRLAAAALW
mmetsp:Transcript_10162/g.22322  ORF Transcript_10162/g.22322 Transcript_10162/m.22322 type:complete len:574 (-) Transcript_10162:126-1847(-)